MRVLFVNDSMKEVGGAETYIFGIAKILKERHEVFFFGFFDMGYKENDRLVLKKSTGSKYIIERFFFSRRVYNSLKDYINEIKPDIIHVHNNYSYSLSILKALNKFPDIPKIQTLHDWGLICPSSWGVVKRNLEICNCVGGIPFKCLKERCINPWHFLLIYYRNKERLRLTKKIFNCFISPSKKLKEYLRRCGFKNVYSLHHFIEFDVSFDLKKVRKGLILYVGVLTKNKGVDYLIKAFKEIKKEFANAKLEIVGDGKERKNLEKLAKKLKLDVIFSGKILHKEVIEKYQSANVLVMPSIWMENSPFVLYETLTVGRPIVGTKRGGIIDLVKGNYNGIVVEAGDVKGIKDAVIKILKNDNLFKKFSENSRKMAVNEFNTKNHLSNLLKIYNTVLNKRL